MSYYRIVGDVLHDDMFHDDMFYDDMLHDDMLHHASTDFSERLN